MHLHGTPHIRCPTCHRLVPLDPCVEIIGGIPMLDCPLCSGVRVEKAVERVLARN